MSRNRGDRNPPGREDGKPGKLTLAIIGDKLKKDSDAVTPLLKKQLT
jgi:hypothetical protein